jgi:hypothetical protein
MQVLSVTAFIRNTPMQGLRMPQCFCKMSCGIQRRFLLSLTSGGADLHVFFKVTDVFQLKNVGL